MPATRTELEAAQKLPVAPILSEAERFAAAVGEMPANVRRFFEPEEEAPPRRMESAEDRAERERLADLGGWGRPLNVAPVLERRFAPIQEQISSMAKTS